MKNYQNKRKEELIQIIESFSKVQHNENVLSEFALKNILSSMYDFIFMFDTKQLFTYINIPKSDKLLLKPKDFIGKEFKNVMPSYIHKQFNDAFNQNRNSKYVQFEYYLEINKETNYFIARFSPLIENHKFKGSIVLISDITKEKNIEIELLRSDKLLKEAAKIGKLGYWELDIINNTLNWSDEIFRIFEISPENFEATYEAFLNNIHPDDREKVNKAYTDSLINKKNYEIEHRLLLKNGTIKYVVEKCNTDFDRNGKPIRSIGTVQDITKEKNILLELKKQNYEYEALNEEYKATIEELKIAENELLKYRNRLEETVKKRTIELEEKNKKLGEFNELFIGREFRIKELRDKIKELESKI